MDVILTVKPMEVTEELVSSQYEKYMVRVADIESNNGGRGFARVIQEKTSSTVQVRWFHQSENKDARIYTNSGSVNFTIQMPQNWRQKWPEFYRELSHYKKSGGNKFDDSEDALTGVYEKSINSSKVTFVKSVSKNSTFKS